MIPSPCINICTMDAQSQLCTGCFRTIDEITIWSRTDDATRANILASIATRRMGADTPVAAMSSEQEDPYICVGICMVDPDSGYCQGCGRPPLASPGIVAEVSPISSQPAYNHTASDPDSPQ